MILDDIRVLLGASDKSKDPLYEIYIRKAKAAIKNYLNTEDDVEMLYPEAVTEHVIISCNTKGNEGVRQYSQGNRSGSLIDGIPDSVKDLLPVPSIRMRG